MLGCELHAPRSQNSHQSDSGLQEVKEDEVVDTEELSLSRFFSSQDTHT